MKEASHKRSNIVTPFTRTIQNRQSIQKSTLGAFWSQEEVDRSDDPYRVGVSFGGEENVLKLDL
jgi:hypothetical protein